MSTTFEHSVKVPRLYKTAAKIAQQVKENGLSLKQLVFEKKHPNVKALYALVLSTLQNEENLDYIFQKTEILMKEHRLDTWLARILITELLWGKKSLPGNSKPITTVLSYQEELLETSTVLNKAKIKTKKVMKPKYVRVNTLKITVEEVVNYFRDDGWSLIRYGDRFDYGAYLATVSSLSEDQFTIDIHVKELLVFAPKTQFYDNKLYKNGCIFLQDKASCLPAYLLNPPEGSTVLDMCSAPGMKSIQLAAMVEKTGKVYAVERDKNRYQTLKKIIDTADASNVITVNQDVLTLPPNDYEHIEMIMVDPSCSGSGMLERLDLNDSNTVYVENRLKNLSRFQIKILKYALTKFKSVNKVVYSTCSIFPQENEEVVKEVIGQIPNYKLLPLNDLLKDKWFNFGSKEFGEIGTRCLYSKSDVDLTNGFFIAVFEKVKEGEVNEFFCAENVYRYQSENDYGDDQEKTEFKEYSDIDVKKNDEIEEVVVEEKNIETIPKKKKRKKKDKLQDDFIENKHSDLRYENITENLEGNVSENKIKRKKNNLVINNELNPEIVDTDLLDSQPNEFKEKRKKKKKREVELNDSGNDDYKRKKKRKSDDTTNLDMEKIDGSEPNNEIKKKKKIKYDENKIEISDGLEFKLNDESTGIEDSGKSEKKHKKKSKKEL